MQRDVVRALEHYELGGKAVAAVEDCSQKFEKYVNFQLLNRLLKRKGDGRPFPALRLQRFYLCL